jgi:hypothetical protein
MTRQNVLSALMEIAILLLKIIKDYDKYVEKILKELKLLIVLKINAL